MNRYFDLHKIIFEIEFGIIKNIFWWMLAKIKITKRSARYGSL